MIKMDINKTEEIICHDEGFRDKPYQDQYGNWTVGFGWNLAAESIPEEVAKLFVHIKSQKINEELIKKLDFYNDLNDIRKSALINMAYNMGVCKLMSFQNTLDLLRQQKYKEASEEAHNSQWAKQVGLRAFRICKMIETGLWPDVIS